MTIWKENSLKKIWKGFNFGIGIKSLKNLISREINCYKSFFLIFIESQLLLMTMKQKDFSKISVFLFLFFIFQPSLCFTQAGFFFHCL